MSEFSPAAQAVLDAYDKSPFDEDCGDRVAIAAALRAAADEVISSVPPPCEDYDEYAQGFLAAHLEYRGKFLEIIAELEAQ